MTLTLAGSSTHSLKETRTLPSARCRGPYPRPDIGARRDCR